jgi:UDP-N-acetylglucosamine 3-dehydrogenase
VSKPLRIALVGAGSMGRHHARVIAESSETELVAIVDPSDSVDELAYRHRSRRLDSIKELLADTRPDAALVAVPTADHAEVAATLLEADIPVLVEKPIAATTEEAAMLVGLAERRGLPLTVGHVERFNPAVTALRDKLHAEELGRVFQVHARRLSPFPLRIGDTGAAFDLATHDLDLMCVLAGTPIRVSAEIDRRAHRTHEDLLAATLRFDSGIIGLLEVNWLTPTKVRQLTVTGERGMLVVDYLNQHLTLYENAHESVSWPTLDVFDGVTEGNVVRFAINRVEPLRAQLDEFVRLVAGAENGSVTPAEGVRALELALAVVESGKRGETLSL